MGEREEVAPFGDTEVASRILGLSLYTEMCARLAARGYQNLKIRSKIWPGAEHLAAIFRAIETLFTRVLPNAL